MPVQQRVALICCVLGLFLVTIAFFLPACGKFSGYYCARFTLTAPYTPFSLGDISRRDWIRAGLLAVSGWVNPLVLVYLLSLVRRKIERFRLPLALAILVCLGTAWITVVESARIFGPFAEMRPLIGQYLWTVGILLILVPEALRVRLPDLRAQQLTVLLPWVSAQVSAQIRKPRGAAICRSSGVLLFVTAFFLPAVGDGNGFTLFGYQCAWLTFLSPLTFLAGLTNIFVASYLAAIVWRRERFQAILAVAALVGVGIAVALVLLFSFDDSGMGPHIHALIGHYLWVAGILLILAPEWGRQRAPNLAQDGRPFSQ